MKMLYEAYNEKTNLFELTIGLESLFAKIMHLDEQFTFNEYLVYKKLKEVTETIMTSDIRSLEQDVENYRSKLEYFIENVSFYSDNSITDKFLNDEIIAIRKLAIQSLNILKTRRDNTPDKTEKVYIESTIKKLRETTNMYLSIIRDVLQHNTKLQTILLSHGIDYREKYELYDI